MRRSIVIHSHFYQPPREHPVFDDVETEASAAPFHDWNQRIERECYRAVVAARVLGRDGRIARIVNTLEWMSFNVGPTLFDWMERAAADTYRLFLAGDRASVERLGHGNAIAQPYHHVILPLASRRDKVTEVRWGMADFRRRFGREPEGMWLPETAVDDETLDVLAQEGIRFTVVAPYQVAGVPPRGHPGTYVTTNGRRIALFPYHGDISHGIAFGGLVRNAEVWLDALWHGAPARRNTPATGAAVVDGSLRESPLLVSAATDGETYGHHHKFADMALARVIEQSRARGGMVENYASFLARYPATFPLTLVSPTAWSCAHGVERWRSDCGCRTDGQANPSQAWRTPLRSGLDALKEELSRVYAREGAALFRDPSAARDGYGAVVSSGRPLARDPFLAEHLRPGANEQDRTRALELLEMQRDALRMFTSCAWFFDDLGLEVRQVLRYAQRGLALSGASPRLEPALLATLGSARSNHATVGTGADVYRSLQPNATPASCAAAAARALGDLRLNVAQHLPHGMQATLDGELVHVVVIATGRTTPFLVRLARQTSNDLAYTVTPISAPGGGVEVSLADFPERSRHALRAAMRTALLPRCLTLEELEQLASGQTSLRGVIAVALTRAIERLGSDQGSDAIELVDATLDLFEQLEASTPFDAQTAFWRVFKSLPARQAAALSGLGGRLGFSAEAIGGG